MIQKVTILQMTGLELEDYVQELSLENPLVEVEEREMDAADKERLEYLEWMEQFDEQNRLYERADREDSDRGDILNVGGPEEDLLEDSLRMQIGGFTKSEEDVEIIEYLIGFLDNRGYFTDRLEDLAIQLEVPLQKLRSCLDIIKAMEPAGIGAACLSECLLLQLERVEKQTGKNLDIEKEIVKDHLELLGKNYLQNIAQKLGKPVSRIEQAAAVIKKLNPKPANGYGKRLEVDYIRPDVIVSSAENGFEIKTDEGAYPKLRVSAGYMRLLKSGSCSREVEKYILEKARQIEQVQGFIIKRQDTLVRLAGFLVEYQQDFFQKGPGNLRPLKMQEMADRMAVHESTVSRAVRGKYLQCSWGIFPLDYFFSKIKFCGQGPEGIASDQMKEKLKDLVEGENKTRPLSDRKLAEQMNRQGIRISRRTVAKYREEMGIPDCRGRKKYGDM